MTDTAKIEKDINRFVKNAWGAAILSAAINLGFTLYFWSGLGHGLLANIYSIGYTLAAVALAYGIYRRSRICAVAMLLLFLFVKALNISAHNTGSTIIVTIFILMFCGGVVGTFFHHRNIKSKSIVGKHMTLATVVCVLVSLGVMFGMGALLTKSADQAWATFEAQSQAEISKLSLPVRMDYYTVLKSVEINNKKLIYTHGVENIDFNEVNYSALDKNNRAIFIKGFCATPMVQQYGLTVVYVYNQGLSEKTLSYDKTDCPTE